MKRCLVLFCVAVLICFSRTSFATSSVYVEPFTYLVNQSIKVQAGTYTYYSFNLTAGDVLTAKFNSSGGLDGKVAVWLLDSQNFQRFQSNQPYSYNSGTSGDVRGSATYTYSIPVSTRFTLVVDNRKALMLARNVNLYVYVTTQQDNPNTQGIRAFFEKQNQQIHDTYLVPDFDITYKHCGMENAYSDPNITLCAELAEKSAQIGAVGNIAFALYHELGHSLLKLWDYPLHDNEDVADEFATVVLLMGGHQNEVIQSVQYWASQPVSRDAAYQAMYSDDRHSMSPKRARNILNWMQNSAELQRRWQRLLVPKMQTAALEGLDKSYELWVDHQLVKDELAKR